jgi:o-succinylbenzoate synthase
MVIQSIQLLSLQVPLHTPFKTSVREVTHIQDLVVKIQCEDGIVGFGAAPSTPQITGDDHKSIQNAVENILSPMLIGQSLSEFDRLIAAVHQRYEVGTNAKAAVDLALFDAYARYKKQPLYRLLSSFRKTRHGKTHVSTVLETDYTISVNDTVQMCRDIDTAIRRGFRCLKIKIGNQPAQDLVRLEAIYAHVEHFYNHTIALRLDANQGWDTETTIHIMQRLEQANITFELIEQPVAAKNIAGLAAIKQHIQTPVMADESAFNLAQVKQLHQQNAVDIINIKLVKAGGIYPAMQIADYCGAHQLNCMIGCMLEGSIGVAAAAHLAGAYPDVITLIDLDGPTLGRFDPIEHATVFDGPRIELNSTPGLGISAQQYLPPWSKL